MQPLTCCSLDAPGGMSLPESHCGVDELGSKKVDNEANVNPFAGDFHWLDTDVIFWYMLWFACSRVDGPFTDSSERNFFGHVCR
jgi:hypothetical protein